MTYLATINTPGYLPDSEPTEHDTARDAWEYLADERKRDEDDAALTFGDDGQAGYSATANLMESIANASLQPIEAGLDDDRTGTITGPTPGYQGQHDLGIAYTVSLSED